MIYAPERGYQGKKKKTIGGVLGDIVSGIGDVAGDVAGAVGDFVDDAGNVISNAAGTAYDAAGGEAPVGSTLVDGTPQGVAAALVAKRQEAEKKRNIISNLLSAPRPEIGEKKEAIQNLKGLANKMDKASSGGLLGTLGPSESRVADKVLDEGVDEDATKKELLAAAETGLVESGFKNLNYGDADSRGWRQERSMYYPNPNDVGASSERFFDELKTDPGTQGAPTAGAMAQAAQGSEFPERYDERKAEAWDIVKDHMDPSDDHPKLAKQLQQAKQAAVEAGVSQRQIGDIVETEPDMGGPKMVKVRADAKGMVEWATHNLGTQEGTPKQRKWADLQGLGYEAPWCADFISVGLERRGIKPPPNPNFVPSFETEWGDGTNIGTDLSKARPGDLVTYSGQHIALYKGDGMVISGNSSDEVAETPADEGPAPISAILRPNYQGGTVRMPVTATNASWGGESSGSAVAGETSTSGGVAEANPILNAALTKTDPATKSNGLSSVLGFLDAPIPKIGEALIPLSSDDELLKLAMRRRV